jgi:hypothetical protein
MPSFSSIQKKHTEVFSRKRAHATEDKEQGTLKRDQGRAVAGDNTMLIRNFFFSALPFFFFFVQLGFLFWEDILSANVI